MVAISIVLTVIITVIMFKVDVGKMAEKIMKKIPFLNKETKQNAA